MGAPAATEATWHRRYDRGELLASVERPDGTLLLEGYAARPGVLVYKNADGTTRRERVTADTLRKSAAGLARSAVTLEHPGEDVTPDNVARHGVGDVDGEVVIEDNGFVRVKMAVRRRDAVDAVKGRKKRELSPGYDVALDETPGVDPELGAYDATQIERRYNHLAIVGVARGGPQVRLRADSGDAVATTSIPISKSDDAGEPAPPPQRGAGMNSRLITLLASLGVSQRVDSDDAAIDAAIDKLKERKDASDKTERERADALAAAVQERDSLKARADKLEADAKADKARADKAEAELAQLRATEQERSDAAERAELVELGKALGVSPRADSDVKAVRRSIAEAHLGGEMRKDATDDEIRGVIAAAKATVAKRGDGREAGRRAFAPNVDRTDAAPVGKGSSVMRDRWAGKHLDRTGGE